MGLTDKLDLLMKEKNINKAELARESGVPYTTIDGFYKKPLGEFKELILLVLNDTDLEDSFGAAAIIEDLYINELKNYLLHLMSNQIEPSNKKS